MTQKTLTDNNELIMLLKTKNHESFSVLYDNYASALFGIAYKFVGNSNICEDILQDVFVKIWKNINAYETAKGTLFTWMLSITRNTCIDYIRSKQHQQQLKVCDEEPWQVEHLSATVYSYTEQHSSELQKLTQKLDAKYKQVLDLVYYQGYSQDEAAKLLNLPLGTVKTRSRAALKQLRVLYNY